jgi:M6 family metalloprotease-like protein
LNRYFVPIVFGMLVFASCGKHDSVISEVELQKKFVQLSNGKYPAKKLFRLIKNREVPSLNLKLLKSLNHSEYRPQILSGKIKALVIPVEFSDHRFKMSGDKSSLSAKLQNKLFSNTPGSISHYFDQASKGKLQVEGIVSPIVAMDKSSGYYGHAPKIGLRDQHHTQLATESILKLKEIVGQGDWWKGFDQFDFSDINQNGIYNEPDGFIDAVMFVHAGASQAFCQKKFDPQRFFPSSNMSTSDEERECYDRIWPHQFMIGLKRSDPQYQARGPLVNEEYRASYSSLKVNNSLFAHQYNMQSIFDPISVYIHEFGHFLGLSDQYHNGENGIGHLDIMSIHSPHGPQNLSAYNKILLGWVRPEIVFEEMVKDRLENESRIGRARRFGPKTDQKFPVVFVPKESQSAIKGDFFIFEKRVTSKKTQDGKYNYDQHLILGPELRFAELAGNNEGVDLKFFPYKDTIVSWYYGPKDGDPKNRFELAVVDRVKIPKRQNIWNQPVRDDQKFYFNCFGKSELIMNENHCPQFLKDIHLKVMKDSDILEDQYFESLNILERSGKTVVFRPGSLNIGSNSNSSDSTLKGIWNKSTNARKFKKLID